MNKISDDKLDAQLVALRGLYLNEMEESTMKSDFKPSTKFQQFRKDESKTMKLTDQCDEIHEMFKQCYLFLNSFSRKVDVRRCIEALKCLNWGHDIIQMLKY